MLKGEKNTRVKDDIMPEIKVTTIGDWNSTTKWLTGIINNPKPASLERIGAMGVRALASATPKDTGATAAGWSYEVVQSGRGWDVVFFNTAHPETRIPVALLIQYGHGTRTGGYVPPTDYINPAMSGIFKQAGDILAKEVMT